MRTEIFKTVIALKRVLSRRNFFYLGGLGLTSGAITVQASSSPLARFFRDRLAELGKPALASKHKPLPPGWDDSHITETWLGHATVLINFYGVHILTDPVLFSRIGAHIRFGTVGPMRRQACALRPSELPDIDLILISHAHLDHLDIPSIKAIAGRPSAVTARRTRDLFPGTRLSRVTELGWGDKIRIATKNGELEVEAFEVQHWGARWRHDKQRGYNGYMLRRGGKQIIFGGDTALASGFTDLHSKGPFEFACMPIGAYDPFIWSHCNPEQALQMTNDAGANYILPMHYFTFRLGREAHNEPIERLEAALNGEPDRLGWREAGQTFVLPG